MTSGYNPSKSIWINPNIEYLFGNDIIEYDIRDAGFSIIKQYKLLPDEKIRELSMMQKGDERHIAIGKLQRDDKELSKRLLEKFTEVRTIFLSANNISDNDIISVYQCLDGVNINENDVILRGQVIGNSGTSTLYNSEFNLHFELYVDGKSVNPEEYYNRSIDEF